MVDWVVHYAVQIWWFSLGLGAGYTLALTISKWRANGIRRSNTRANTTEGETKTGSSQDDVRNRGSSLDTTHTTVSHGRELGSNSLNTSSDTKDNSGLRLRKAIH